MPTAHLIAGLPCSGKTTYATALQADLGCVLFTLDRWLIKLFGQYSLDAVGHKEHARRVLACRELIWSSAAELLRRSVDVILDDGFLFREHRSQHVKLARQAGAATRIHFIETPLEVVEARLRRRNADLPAVNFHVSPDMLGTYAGLFERPPDGEGAALVVVRGAAAAGKVR